MMRAASKADVDILFLLGDAPTCILQGPEFGAQRSTQLLTPNFYTCVAY
jgi:hypothetical protein